MGRGRKGVLNQSQTKLNPHRHRQIAMVLGRPHKSDETKINLHEGVLEFMKNMNHQELVNFLLTNAKTSGNNASGC